MPKRTDGRHSRQRNVVADKESKPKPSATQDHSEGSQAERFKALAKDEGLDTPEAHERFKRSLFVIAAPRRATVAKGKPKT